MNKIMKLLRGKQSGQALVLALALLGVGSLMIAPMLSFMGTGLNAGVVAEDKMDELYACDAGVQDAIWNINNLDEPGAIPYAYLDGVDNDTGLPIIPPYEVYDYIDPVIGRTLPHVNGMDVGVRITLEDMIDGFGVYRVQTWVPVQPEVSFGVNWGNASTKIDTIITTVWLDYSGITENVVTSPNGYRTQGPTTLEPGEGEPGGPVGDYGGAWPTAEELAAYYSRDVDKDNPYPDDELLLTGDDVNIGPEYIDSDFYVHSNDNQNETLTLDGTLYITGQVEFGGPKDFTIDLNGNTIFIESDATGGGASGTALWITGNVTITGSGCIIAVGDINFEPQMDSSPSDYILILSVEGQTWMHPNGDFYGTLAGFSEVFIQNGQAHHTDPPDDLNFPGGGGGGMIWGIHTWMYWDIKYETP